MQTGEHASAFEVQPCSRKASLCTAHVEAQGETEGCRWGEGSGAGPHGLCCSSSSGTGGWTWWEGAENLTEHHLGLCCASALQ